MGQKGIQELNYVVESCNILGVNNLKINLSLARGLDYYTGSIFEVVLNNNSMGSIVGGGRYDNLTEVFGQKNLSGVGVSFGAERIYDLMNDLDLFPNNLDTPSKYMIVDKSESAINGLKLLHFLRSKNIPCILYPDNIQLKKQLKYAHSNKIPLVVFLKEDFSSEIKVDLINIDTSFPFSYFFISRVYPLSICYLSNKKAVILTRLMDVVNIICCKYHYYQALSSIL